MQSKNRLDGMRVAILVSDDFEQVEMTEPRKVLDQAGARTFIISPKADRFPVDMTLEQANPNDFDALMLPGGALNADSLRVNPRAQYFIRFMDGKGRPIAAICHAPWLLVSAGCVRGRTLTSWPTIQDDIRNAGGHWLDQEMVRDRNWVTSRGPQDLPAFNQEMLMLFSEYLVQKSQQRQTMMSA